MKTRALIAAILFLPSALALAQKPVVDPPLPQAVSPGGFGYPGYGGFGGMGMGGGYFGGGAFPPGMNGMNPPEGPGAMPPSLPGAFPYGAGSSASSYPPGGFSGGISGGITSGMPSAESSVFPAYDQGMEGVYQSPYSQSRGGPGRKPRAYLNNQQGCPFARDKGNDANALIGGVINALTDLQNKCPALEQSIRNFQSQAQHMNTLMQEQGDLLRPDGTTDVTCTNFEYVLRREYDFVSSHPSQLQRAARYYPCTMVMPEEQRACMDSQYAEELSAMAYQCKTKATLANQEAIRKGLQSFVKQSTTLIQESDRCGSAANVAQIMTNIGINTLSTIGAIAPMAGLSGAMLGMGGQLLNSLVNKLFSKAAPQEGIKALYNEMEAENISCLWFSLQNRTLNCAQRSAARTTPRLPELGCRDLSSGGLQQNLATVMELDQLLRKTASPASPADPAWGQQLLAQLEQPVESPDGTPGQKIPLQELLGRMRDTLAQSPNVGDQQQASQLQAFLGATEQLRRMWDKSKNLPLDQRLAVLQSASGAVKWNLATTARTAIQTSFALPKIAESYWRLQGQGDEFARLRAVNGVQNLIAHGYEIAVSTKTDLLAPDEYQQDLAIASNYMVEHFQDYFAERLKKLNDRYERNKEVGDTLQLTADLVPLYKTCSQMAGMFYAKPVSDPVVDRALNQLRDRPLESFEKACGRFSCDTKPKLFGFFNPREMEGPNVPQKFRAYQCGAVENFAASRDQLLKNLESSGSVCGGASGNSAK